MAHRMDSDLPSTSHSDSVASMADYHWKHAFDEPFWGILVDGRGRFAGIIEDFEEYAIRKKRCVTLIIAL